MAEKDEAPRHEAMNHRGAPFYKDALRRLHEADVPFLVGGAFALRLYTGIGRWTKDFDLFLRPSDLERAMGTLAAGGYRTEIAFDHWLAKAHCGEDSLDLIYSSGNGVSGVDDTWFEHATRQRILDLDLLFCPVEEIIWSKAFIQERERFDGADVQHLLHCCAETLDWERMLRRFGAHWRVLLSHLVLFGFVYPAERSRVPWPVMRELLARLEEEEAGRPPSRRVCRGTLLSRAQYLVDIEKWGYEDARLRPHGSMTAEQIERWTEVLPEEDIPS